MSTDRMFQVLTNHWGKYVFNAAKYPAHIYDSALQHFSKPRHVTPDQVEAALRWKYGRATYSDYPKRQKDLAARIASDWTSLHATPATSLNPEALFNSLRQTAVPYITSTFLVHLVMPAQSAIIDQHNYRAMFALSREAGLELGKQKTVPRTWQDAQDVTAFIGQIASINGGGWSGDARKVDQFLMAMGAAIK